MATVEVSFVYLKAAPTHDTLSSSPFYDGYPIKLNATDEVHELIRQIMARYDVADATVYQPKTPEEYTSDELYKQLTDSPRGVLQDIANVIRPSRIIGDLLKAGGSQQTFIVVLGAPATVKVRFVYLDAAPTRDTLFSSHPFRLADPIKLNATDEVHELIRQIMARCDVVDATVYQHKRPAEYTSDELYKQLTDSPRGVLHDIAKQIPPSRIIEYVLSAGGSEQTLIVVLGAPAKVKVWFFYLDAAPTRDTLSSNPFRLADPIKLNATDEVHDLSRQIMARYDVVDATVYQPKMPEEYTSDELYEQLKDSPRGALEDIANVIRPSRIIRDLLQPGSAPQTFIVLLGGRGPPPHMEAEPEIEVPGAYLYKGSWLVIEGAVLTSRNIVQRLTPYMSLEFSQLLGDRQVYTVARHLYALKRGVEELSEFYRTLTAPQVTPTFIHPRFCPYRTSFVNADGVKVTFQYVRPFERYVGCVIFEAKLSTQDSHAVVKFVREYGRDAHAHMAQAGYAPTLFHFGELGDGYEDLALVVMEYVDGPTLADAFGVDNPLPADVHADVCKALSVLNGGGYVFGDLRRQNIMLAKHRRNKADTRIRFIDFDWAGKAGEVRYPAHVSPVILGAAGAKAFEPILQKHQDGLFIVL